MKIKIFRDIEQRTDEWLAVKAGKTSGTGMKSILTSRTTKPLETYAYKLIAQIENNQEIKYEQGFLSKAVQWGVDMEPLAIKAFIKRTSKLVEEVGWVESLDEKLIGQSGASPDGIITIKEWVEVKCLDTANHIRCVAENAYPKEYYPQVLNYFIINEDLEVLYFVLYDPRVTIVSKQLHIIEILRSDIQADIDKGYDKLVSFLELKEQLHKIYLQ